MGVAPGAHAPRGARYGDRTLSQTIPCTRRLILTAAAMLASTSAAVAQPSQPQTPPMLEQIDRVGIVFTDLDPDVGAGRPTISARVQWVEGPFYTPVMADSSGEISYLSHLTIAISAADFYRWDGPPHLLPEFLPADINRDGVVDQGDFAELLAAWGGTLDDYEVPSN